MKTHACQQHLLTNDPIYENIHVYIQCNALINVNPEGGGAGHGVRFYKLCLPVGEGFEVLKLPGSVGF